MDRLGADLQDESCPPEINRGARTLLRGKDQIVNWHTAHVSNAPTEAMNNLIKRIKRVGFGFRKFAYYRVRALLYAGKPNWALLATITPRCDPKSPITDGGSRLSGHGRGVLSVIRL